DDVVGDSLPKAVIRSRRVVVEVQVAGLPAAVVDDQPLVTTGFDGAVLVDAPYRYHHSVGGGNHRHSFFRHDVDAFMRPGAPGAAAVTEAIGQDVRSVDGVGERNRVLSGCGRSEGNEHERAQYQGTNRELPHPALMIGNKACDLNETAGWRLMRVREEDLIGREPFPHQAALGLVERLIDVPGMRLLTAPVRE